MDRSINRLVFLKNYLFRSNIRVCFKLVASVREHLVIN